MTSVRMIDPQDRNQLTPLLNVQAASDALAAYCALLHPQERLKLYVSYDGGGKPNGFMALTQTGMDLFRPLAVPFVASSTILHALLSQALTPGQPAVLYLPLEQREWLDGNIILSETRVTELLRLDSKRFKPILNVLVLEVDTPTGLPRFEIRTRSGSFAAAGINWMGDRFSEIYLEADEEAQARGLALSVLAAMSNRLLDTQVIPLFGYDDSAGLDFEELRNIGYRSTGTRTLVAQVLRKPET